ncbi:MAG TPA: hypothetical protein VFW22_07505 [Pseudolabrys sp.]|nr:hypothetical protein [Pseudolabrys sp.]
MATRPCKPGADEKRLWQRLLPDTPFPACRTQESKDDAEPAPAQNDEQPPRDGVLTRRD